MNPGSTPDAIELELKFAVRNVEVEAVEAALPAGAKRLHTRVLANQYFDTDDGLLHRQGVAIRIRSVDDTHEMTAKIREPDEGGLSRRQEWNLPLTEPKLDWDQLHALPLPRPVLDSVRSRGLRVVFENTLRRTDWQVLWDTCEAIVSLDLGEVATPRGASPVSEIEIEWLSGAVPDLIALGCALSDRLPSFMAVISKAERGERLLRQAGPRQDPAPQDAKGWLYRLSRMLDPLAGPSPTEAVEALRSCADAASFARFAPIILAGELPNGLGRWMVERSLEEHP